MIRSNHVDNHLRDLFKICNWLSSLDGRFSKLSLFGEVNAMAVVVGRRFFQQIGGTIQELLSTLDTGSHFELVRLIKLWPEVVGETITRRTEISSLKFRTVVIKVSSAMWIQELNLMRPQILSRLKAAMPNDAVREIRFVPGRLSRRERPHLRPIARPARRPIEMPQLKDAELRRAFANLIEAWGRALR